MFYNVCRTGPIAEGNRENVRSFQSSFPHRILSSRMRVGRKGTGAIWGSKNGRKKTLVKEPVKRVLPQEHGMRKYGTGGRQGKKTKTIRGACLRRRGRSEKRSKWEPGGTKTPEKDRRTGLTGEA